MSKQFCPKGHDTLIVGRHAGRCGKCSATDSKKWQKDHPEKVKQTNKRMNRKHPKLKQLRKQWWKDHLETTREYNWKAQGILNEKGLEFTVKDYNRLLELQESKCAMCGTDIPDKGRKFFCVDHNHTTGKVRGLLCFTCNVALGTYEEIQLKARKYLFNCYLQDRT